MGPRYLPHVLALTVLGFAAALLCWSPILLDDQWWHMLTGRYLLETGAVPTVDPFSYTAHGEPWVNWEWLAGLLMYLVYDAAGGTGLVVLRWVAVMGAVATVWAHLCAREDRTPIALVVRVLLSALTLLVIFGRVSDRPHLYALPLVAAVHYIAWRPPRVAHVYLLMGLMIPWVLLHPSWPLGVVIVSAFVATRMKKTPIAYRAAPVLMLVPALVLHDLSYYADAVVGLFGTSELREWQPLWTYLHWTNTPLVAFLLLSAALVAAFVVAPAKLKEPESLVAVALGLGSLWFVRFTPLFAVVAAPILHDTFTSHEKAEQVPARSANLAAVLAGLLLLLVVVQTKSVFKHPYSSALDPRSTPVSVAAFLERHQLGGNVFCNEMNAHAYLAYARYPDVYGYIDGRVPQLFDESAWLRYLDATRAPANLSAVLDETDTQLVVLQNVFSPIPSALTHELAEKRDDFALVFFDETALLWVRRDQLAKLADPPPSYELVVPPLISDGWFQSALTPDVFPQVVAELRQLRKHQPDSTMGALLVQTLARHPRASAEQRAALAPLLR